MSEAEARSRGSHLLLLLELLLFSVGLAGVLVMQVQRQQPQPYMDEQFHVGMAQRYCAGDYRHWDPKVTTPPGLYAYSAALLRATAAALGRQPAELCDTFRLRLTSLPALALSLLALYGVVSSAASPRGLSPRLQALKAFSLAMFPVSFFFTSLYYTDQLSQALVLVMYFLHLNEHRLLAGACGLAAMCCRQTNAVWLLLCLGERLEAECLRLARHRRKKKDDDLRDDDDDDNKEEEEAEEFDAGRLEAWARLAVRRPLQLLAAGLRAATQAWPYCLALAAFAAFVVANGGVALGDKAAHAATLHSAHPLYFVAFCAAFQPHAFLHPDTLRLCLRPLLSARGRLATLALLAACWLAVYAGTVEHPYLLADNRHFAFYLWRWVYRRHWLVKYALVPAYAYSLCAFCRLAPHRSAAFPPLLLLCASAALVPAGLLEPRYYILPFLLWRLHAAKFDSASWLALELFYYAAINAGVYRLFLWRPFAWPDGSQQRFLW